MIFLETQNLMPNPRYSATRRLVTGTLLERVLNAAPGEQLARCPKPPAHLSAGAKTEWKRLAPVVHKLGTMRGADLTAFALLCSTLATATEAAEVVRREGMTLATGSGGTRSHPAIKAMETARGQAQRLLAEFGLTPRSSGSVDRAPAPGRSGKQIWHRDPADKYFS